jgi:CBS domain-containing protein
VRISEFMTSDPAWCVPGTTAQEAAVLMRDNDCGAIPVVEDENTLKLVGVITDRDLAVRGVAEGLGPETPVRELMTVEPVGADPDDEIEVVREVMIREQVRRVPVIGKDGKLVGIIAQAALARQDAAASDREVGRIVEAISQAESNN